MDVSLLLLQSNSKLCFEVRTSFLAPQNLATLERWLVLLRSRKTSK